MRIQRLLVFGIILTERVEGLIAQYEPHQTVFVLLMQTGSDRFKEPGATGQTVASLFVVTIIRK